MACGTILIAFVPGYATIGLLAPALVLIGRLLQGFSAGAELGGVSVYLPEMATPGNKGFYVSWQSASQQVAIVVAARSASRSTSGCATAEIAAWGWRIPFFVGCMIVPFIFIMRRKLQETEEFEARKHHPTTAGNLRPMVAQLDDRDRRHDAGRDDDHGFYLITVYTPTFGKTVLHLTRPTACSSRCASASRISSGCRSAARCRTGSAAGRSCSPSRFWRSLTAYPALSSGSRTRRASSACWVELLWLSFMYGMYNGAMVVALTEVMPVQVRVVGLLARLQPRDGAVRRLHAGDLDLADQRHRRQGRARLLDELRGGLRPRRDARAVPPAAVETRARSAGALTDPALHDRSAMSRPASSGASRRARPPTARPSVRSSVGSRRTCSSP